MVLVYLLAVVFVLCLISIFLAQNIRTQDAIGVLAIPEKPFYTKIRGVTFRNKDGTDRQELIRKLKPDQPLRLVRDHDVAESGTAIMICSEAGALGYLAGKHSQGIAPIMDEGYEVSVVVKNITGGYDGNPVGCNIEIFGIRVVEEYDPEDAELAKEFGEKYDPPKRYYPSGEKKLIQRPQNEPQRIESRLAMEIPPWETEEGGKKE